MRRLHGVFLALMLMSQCGCRDTASPAGSQPDSVEPAAGESAAILAAQALDTSLPQAQRRDAATRMMTAAEPDAAIPSMHSLLATSDDDSVREMMAKRLGDLRDMDSSPQLIEAMGDSSTRVREAAAHSLIKMLGRDYFFRPDDPPDLQRAAQDRYRRYWDYIQGNPYMLETFRERNQQLRREGEAALRPEQE